MSVPALNQWNTPHTRKETARPRAASDQETAMPLYSRFRISSDPDSYTARQMSQIPTYATHNPLQHEFRTITNPLTEESLVNHNAEMDRMVSHRYEEPKDVHSQESFPLAQYNPRLRFPNLPAGYGPSLGSFRRSPREEQVREGRLRTRPCYRGNPPQRSAAHSRYTPPTQPQRTRHPSETVYSPVNRSSAPHPLLPPLPPKPRIGSIRPTIDGYHSDDDQEQTSSKYEKLPPAALPSQEPMGDGQHNPASVICSVRKPEKSHTTSAYFATILNATPENDDATDIEDHDYVFVSTSASNIEALDEDHYVDLSLNDTNFQEGDTEEEDMEDEDAEEEDTQEWCDLIR